jgi:hypothetical protein
MKKLIVTLLLAGLVSVILSACGGGYGGGYYRGHYGHGAWRGYPGYGYIDRGPIIVAPPGGGGDLEAIQLPEHPIDMGGPEAMPMEPMMDMDMGGMDMDMGMPEIDFD